MFNRKRSGMPWAPTLVGAAVIAGAVIVTGVTSGDGAVASTAFSSGESSSVAEHGEARTIRARVFAKVVDAWPTTPFGNNVAVPEGPSFGPDGNLYLTDASAPAGGPKVVKLDMRTKAVTTVHTDETSIYSSTQFSPKDGRLYTTDFAAGTIESMNPDGSDVSTVHSGPVDGSLMKADDLAFDQSGNMYVTDMVGSVFSPTGRIVRIAAQDGAASVVQGGMASPNGISFTPDYAKVWVSEYTAGRVARFAVGADGSLRNGVIGLYASTGIDAQLDSNAVDADGNLYQCVQRGGQVLIWSPQGELRAIVKLSDNFKEPNLQSTNMAIKPGTRDAYITSGGPNGIIVYRFTALGVGIRQSNGG